MIPVVMCVDDDPIVLMLNELVLRDHAFCNELIKIESAELALEHFSLQSKKPLAQAILPNILFLDINMPTMDGWGFLDAFTEKFQEFHSKVSIVILSSSVNPADIEKANKHPLVIGFMPKPIGDTELNELKKHPALSIYLN
ncbi:MAG: response regulator [Sediminibacterium sp.]|jgi:CheY-like chemotaxis protein